MKAGALIAVVLLASASYAFGNAVGTENGKVRVEYKTKVETKVEYKTRTVTKYKTRTKTKYKTDPDCKDLAHRAKLIAEQAELIYGLQGEQLEILSDGRIALAKGTSSMNDIENRQRDLKSRAVEPFSELQEQLNILNQSKGCK